MSGTRILLVEDESIVAMDMQRRLTSLGYEVVDHVLSGEEAVAHTLALRPDLVLMDIHLKGSLDGIEAAGQINEQAAIPVIYITAYSDESTLSRAKITQPYGYILKPFQEREIHSTIEMALYKHKVEQELKKAEAEAGNRAKSQFLANVSHELRTPLNSILGMTQLALESKDKGEQEEYLRIVKESGSSLLGLIDSILDFSRLEAGSYKLNVSEFYLDEVIEQSVEKIIPQLSKKNIKVFIDIDERSQFNLLGDENKFSQILNNLLDNAAKFTEEGSITLRVKTDPADEKGLIRVQGSVTDTGCGIDPEQGDTIFTAFHQADGSSTRSYSGTGLGLAIVKQIAEFLNGGISYTSQPGKGSSFYFTLEFAGSDPKKEREWEKIDTPEPPEIYLFSTDRTCLDIRARQFEAHGWETIKIHIHPNADDMAGQPANRRIAQNAIFMVEDEQLKGMKILRTLEQRGVPKERLIFIRRGSFAGKDSSAKALEVAFPYRRKDLFSSIGYILKQLRVNKSKLSFPKGLTEAELYFSLQGPNLSEGNAVYDYMVSMDELISRFSKPLSSSDFNVLSSLLQKIRDRKDVQEDSSIDKVLLKLILAARKHDGSKVQEIFSELKKKE